MVKNILTCNILLILIVNYTSAIASENISINYNVSSASSSEAGNASVTGSQALFYNPAGLAYNYYSLRVLGSDLQADTRNSEDSTEILGKLRNNKLKDLFSLEKLYSFAEESDSYFISPSYSLLEVVVPYFSVIDFTNYLFEKDTSEKLDFTNRLDIGAIVGVAVAYKNFSMGASLYSLNRFQINSEPNSIELTNIQKSIKNNQGLANQKIDSFTHMSYGSAVGANLGLQYKFIEGNLSGIGFSILNAGGTDFDQELTNINSSLGSLEEFFQENSELHTISMEKPKSLQEKKNFGLALGWGGE